MANLNWNDLLNQNEAEDSNSDREDISLWSSEINNKPLYNS